MDKSERKNKIFNKYLKRCVTRQAKQVSTLEESTKQKQIFNTALTLKASTFSQKAEYTNYLF